MIRTCKKNAAKAKRVKAEKARKKPAFWGGGYGKCTGENSWNQLCRNGTGGSVREAAQQPLAVRALRSQSDWVLDSGSLQKRKAKSGLAAKIFFKPIFPLTSNWN
jgi:hypothetical protein